MRRLNLRYFFLVTLMAGSLLFGNVKPANALSAVQTVVSTVQQIFTTVVDGMEIAIAVVTNVTAQLVQLGIDETAYTLNPQPGDYSLGQQIVYFFSPQDANNPLNANDNKYSYRPANFTGGGAGNGAFNRAAYFKWQMIQPPVDSGATCGDGSPYKFFVNLSPVTTNVMFVFEPGGACFGFSDCSNQLPSGKADPLAAFNPHGIPDTYMSIIGFANGTITTSTAPIESPLDSRVSIGSTQHVRQQDWNIVYLPYCSGDVFAGDAIKAYYNTANNSQMRIQHYNGLKNVLAAIGWYRNSMPRPSQMLDFGMSAGSVAVDAVRPVMRQYMQPDTLYTLADSGTVFPTQRKAGDSNTYPSTNLHNLIASVIFNYDDSQPTAVNPLNFLKQLLPNLNPGDLSTIGSEYVKTYPTDRILYVNSQNDTDFSSYSYQFHPGMRPVAMREGVDGGVPAGFFSQQGKFTNTLYTKDIAALKARVDATSNSNVGYFQPSGRLLNQSHCMFVVNYEGTTNPDTGHDAVAALQNLMKPGVPVFREHASDQYWGLFQPVGPQTQAFAPILGSNGLFALDGSPGAISIDTSMRGALTNLVANNIVQPQNTNATALQLAVNTNNNAFIWSSIGNGLITNIGGVCLDTTDNTAGSSLVQQACSGMLSQQWYIDRFGVLRNGVTGRAADGGNGQAGTSVALQDATGKTTQQWSFK